MLVKGDKIKQVKEIPGFNYVGTEFEVDGFMDMKVQFHGAIGQGVMTLAEFEEYFERVVAPPSKPRRVWTEWKPWGFDDKWESPVLDVDRKTHHYSQYDYRTNQQKVQMRTTLFPNIHKSFLVEASCSPCDTFDLDKGLRLCVARMRVKILAATM